MVAERDYFDTYAPVTQIISMKMFYFVAIYYKLETAVYDIKSAFLNAQMDTDVWCALPDVPNSQTKTQFLKIIYLALLANMTSEVLLSTLFWSR